MRSLRIPYMNHTQTQLSNNSHEPVPVFLQNPPPYEKHPKNFLIFLGQILTNYRESLPKKIRSREIWGEVLKKYIGTPVDKNRIAQTEQGDTSVPFEVFVAYFCEMGVLPDIVKAIHGGEASDLRYLTLLNDELSPEIQAAMQEAEIRLSQRKNKEVTAHE